MTWFRVLLAAAVIGGGVLLAIPEEKPRYLGDMPSLAEQQAALRPPPDLPEDPAPAGPAAPAASPDGAAPPAPVVRRPPVEVAEVGLAGRVPGTGPRVPEPVRDNTLRHEPGSPGGKPVEPMPGTPEYEEGSRLAEELAAIPACRAAEDASVVTKPIGIGGAVADLVCTD